MRYRLSNLVFDSDLELPELAASADPGPAETSVVWKTAAPPAARSPFSSWRTPDDDTWLEFAEADDGVLLTFPGLARFAVVAGAGRVDVFPGSGVPAATVRHLLLNQVIPLVISRRGRIVLHASAVSYADRVVAFIGRSGTGKSTLAAQCALAGGRIVSDDCLVIEPAGAGWRAVPCGAGLRLWPESLDLLGLRADAGAAMAHYTEKRRVSAAGPALDFAFEDRTLPLAAIYRLGPDGPPGGELLTGRDAVMSLAAELFRLDVRDPDESRRQFEAIAALARAVPVRRAPREKPDAAARRVLCRM